MEQKAYKLLKKEGSHGNKNTTAAPTRRPTDAECLPNSFKSPCWLLKCHCHNKTPIFPVFQGNAYAEVFKLQFYKNLLA